MIDTLSHFKGKRIGVAGFGYIGKHLVDFLNTKSEKYQYTVSTFMRSNIESICGQEFDFFFNCAGNTGDFRNKLWATIDSNLDLTRFLLENIHIRECYVSLSSTRLYGFSEDRDVLFEEKDIYNKKIDHLSVDFVYDGTKMLLESILWNYSTKVDFKISICRLSNLYGRYTKEDLNDSTYLKLMIRSAIEGRRLLVEQNTSDTKGYIFIDDAILGIVQSAIFARGSDIYNICSGESYSIEEWLKYLNIDYTAVVSLRPSMHSRISIQKAASKLNFQPRFFLHNLEFDKILQNGSNKTV